MTTGEVAERLGVSRERVYQLDIELRVARCACGRRRYDPAAVAAYERQRVIDRAELAAARASRLRSIRAEHPPSPRRPRF